MEWHPGWVKFDGKEKKRRGSQHRVLSMAVVPGQAAPLRVLADG